MDTLAASMPPDDILVDPYGAITTIADGLAAMGEDYQIVGIAPGTYHERVIITQNHSNITLLGMGKSPEDVVITNSLNAKQAGGTEGDCSAQMPTGGRRRFDHQRVNLVRA